MRKLVAVVLAALLLPLTVSSSAEAATWKQKAHAKYGPKVALSVMWGDVLFLTNRSQRTVYVTAEIRSRAPISGMRDGTQWVRVDANHVRATWELAPGATQDTHVTTDRSARVLVKVKGARAVVLDGVRQAVS